jgi:hypothetical protein
MRFYFYDCCYLAFDNIPLCYNENFDKTVLKKKEKVYCYNTSTVYFAFIVTFFLVACVIIINIT